MGKKYKITTFGCQMNKSDSERIKTLLAGIDMSETESETDADLLIYNTCSVRQKAEDRVYGQKKNVTRLKKENPNLVVAVTGCMPGRDKTGEIRDRLSFVDLFFPTNEMVHLPKRLAEINPLLYDAQNALTQEGEYDHYLKIKPTYGTQFSAFVPISTGCNKMCAYCVVPFSRGKQTDRPYKDVIEEVKTLIANGHKEVTLLGQTVNWYLPPDKDEFSSDNKLNKNPKNYFGALLWEVNQIPGLERLHYTAAHPNHMTPEVIVALTLPKHLNYLHLPVQAGNNEVLEKMNRPYTREDFLKVIGQIKKVKPDIALGTDIIVGFSGETEEQFEETVSLYKECQFDISYTAMYSVRSGTLAADKYPDDVPQAEKKRRWEVLQKLMEEIVLEKNQRLVNTTVSVLVDKVENGTCQGNSREMNRVLFRGDESLLGQIIPVHIDRALEWVLYGSDAR